ATAFTALRARRAPASPDAVIARDASGRGLAPGQWVAAGPSPSGLQFSDGSSVRLEAGARVRLLETTARGVDLVVERGALEVQVTHGERTRWRVRTGPWSVVVTGTAFRVAWTPGAERLDLAMRRGRVRVEGPRGVAQAVSAGEHVVADASGLRPAATPPATPVEEVAREVVASEQLQAPAPVPARHRRGPRGARGPSAEATAPVERAIEPAPPAPAGGAAFSVSRDADRARYEGRVGDARALLLELRLRYPESPEARRAAHVLGVLALESQRAPAVAARWFEIALREDPAGPLRRESLGRRVQALHAAGDVPGARRAASEYLRVDPEGAFAAFARSVLGR
ncbi:MAG: FecR family protein, partial [Kofleriaceae bacterium]